MGRYLLRKLAFHPTTFVVAVSVDWAIPRFMPGDPIQGLISPWLFPNTTRKPLDDAAFRRALAHAINLDRIVSADYGGIVEKANPTGLLPIWDEFIDDDLVAAKGFTYDIAKAKQLLAEAGYEDADGDGYVENKDGSQIDLALAVPNGWSDWMTAIQIISRSAKAAGMDMITHLQPPAQ